MAILQGIVGVLTINHMGISLINDGLMVDD
jgi:hypothetical protein